MDKIFSADCLKCSLRIRYASLAGSLLLAMAKGAVGMLGASEALAADGIFSFYQCYMIYREGEHAGKHLFIVQFIVSIILTLGIADVFIFSVIKLFKASDGILMDPSPFALCVAIVSILANYLFYTFMSCTSRNECTKLNPLFKRAMIISTIVFGGALLSRTIWLPGDPMAAVIVGGIVLRSTLVIIVTTFKKASSMAKGEKI